MLVIFRLLFNVKMMTIGQKLISVNGGRSSGRSILCRSTLYRCDLDLYKIDLLLDLPPLTDVNF